ncbi:uncharacterized protein KIAA0513-like isoform X1 [Scyliorhinus torazame]|uniref:uncharacterized protein KIAA0513-like isoform X1 n=1 Tax=Scyliorhinus torazame TaxID=75743 RepID=UPI003B5B97E4
MGSQDFSHGNLKGLDSDAIKDESLCLTKDIGSGQSDRMGQMESDDTNSADSDNGLEDSLTNTTWDNSRRASSNESFSSRQSVDSVLDDEAVLECREFMRRYVEKVFSGREEIGQEEKGRFGELCSDENNQGREWFAKYVSAQRCHSKCISEHAFYRLVQSFAVVLFECYQMDDFAPAKNLMTMCFTFYHVGKPCPNVFDLRLKSTDSSVRTGNRWLTQKKEHLLKNTETMKGFFGGLERKFKVKNEDAQNLSGETSESVRMECLQKMKGIKIYLYTHLKQQPIWHALRFWNAAFFDAVHCERRKRSPTTREKWCHMTPEERDDSHRFNENIAFGQLGTFTHNMLAFGLSKKLCTDFLKKQSVIGNLNHEQYKLLCDHIDQMTIS